MTHHHRRLDPPRPPQLRQRILQRKQGGLRVRRLVHGRALPPSRIEHLQKRPFKIGSKKLIAALHSLAEGRLGLEKLLSHPHILGPLTREKKGDLGPVRALHPAAQYPRLLFVGNKGSQLFARLLRRWGYGCNPVSEVRPSSAGRETHIPKRGGGTLPQMTFVSPRQILQGRFALPRERKNMHRSLHLRHQNLRSRRLFQDNVRVRPAETERTHTGNASALSKRPRDRLCRDP